MSDYVAFGKDVADFDTDVCVGDDFEGFWLGDLRLVLDDDVFDLDGDVEALLAGFDLVPCALEVACLPLDLTMVFGVS